MLNLLHMKTICGKPQNLESCKRNVCELQNLRGIYSAILTVHLGQCKWLAPAKVSQMGHKAHLWHLVNRESSHSQPLHNAKKSRDWLIMASAKVWGDSEERSHLQGWLVQIDTLRLLLHYQDKRKNIPVARGRTAATPCLFHLKFKLHC